MPNNEYWKKQADKAEWIHSQYVDIYKPYSGKTLSDGEKKQLQKEFNRVEKAADKLFGKI